ncbi:MAG TPA: HD domain-containing protein [Caldilineaceae bacterium]|nr:HD domain-containing protein [Caldilineaceae bacterium]
MASVSAARIYYRVGQFLRGLSATLRAGALQPGEAALVAALLPPQAQTLFAAMPADAQRHSLNVLQTLHRAGHREPELAMAALLHDVGKLAAQAGGIQIGLWLRGPLVLCEAFAPGVLRRLAVDDPARGWRYALHVQLEHAAIGARWAAQAGCPPLACWLIAHHQDRLQDPAPAAADQTEDAAAPGALMRRRLLAALQWADNQN